VQHIKLPAVPKALMKRGSGYRNKLQRDVSHPQTVRVCGVQGDEAEQRGYDAAGDMQGWDRTATYTYPGE